MQILGRLESPDRVAQGPFRGMRYISSAFCSELLPKLVGTYERELYPAIEAICLAGCDRIVDIGAAEGYYAVGMAVRNPDAEVVAFEMNPSARYYLRRLADRNEVSERVQILSLCELHSLASTLAGARRPAVICDCEGAEDELLRPDQIDPLRRAYLLVETHDGLETDAGILTGITDRLHERFEPTHTIELIGSRARTRQDLATDCPLSSEEAAEAMDEGRPWAQWLLMTPTAD
jgi:Met-10+ like-protein